MKGEPMGTSKYENYTVKVEHLSKRFKKEQVLCDVNLELSQGHIYGIIGRNGSGKSVLFKLMCGFLFPDEGSVTINGKVIGKDRDFPENFGALIEAPGFLWYQSGIANLEYLAGIRKLITKQEVEDAMRLVGLDPTSKKRVGKYSLGMKQRLGIAQAIMEHPQFIILDEPMNGLDESGIRDMRQLFLKLKNEGCLVILASHNKEDIGVLCDEVYQIANGRLQKQKALDDDIVENVELAENKTDGESNEK